MNSKRMIALAILALVTNEARAIQTEEYILRQHSLEYLRHGDDLSTAEREMQKEFPKEDPHLVMIRMEDLKGKEKSFVFDEQSLVGKTNVGAIAREFSWAKFKSDERYDEYFRKDYKVYAFENSKSPPYNRNVNKIILSDWIAVSVEKKQNDQVKFVFADEKQTAKFREFLMSAGKDYTLKFKEKEAEITQHQLGDKRRDRFVKADKVMVYDEEAKKEEPLPEFLKGWKESRAEMVVKRFEPVSSKRLNELLTAEPSNTGAVIYSRPANLKILPSDRQQNKKDEHAVEVENSR